jgi:hypothetical protein
MDGDERRDPWAFQRWAFGVTTGSTPRKAVLMMLSSMADWQTGRCEAKQATLAAGTEASERTVRDHLRGLEEAGVIARRRQVRVDGSRRGDEFLLLAPWVTEWPDGQPAAPAGTPGERASSLPADDDRSNRQLPPGKNNQQERPKEQTPASRARTRPMTYRSRPVPREVQDLAGMLVEVFGVRAGRSGVHAYLADGSPTPEMRQVVGAMMARPNVSGDEWLAAINATAANPPSWVDGPLQVGHVFGERAAAHALAAGRGEAPARPQQVNGAVSRREAATESEAAAYAAMARGEA